MKKFDIVNMTLGDPECIKPGDFISMNTGERKFNVFVLNEESVLVLKETTPIWMRLKLWVQGLRK